jgi:cytochrome c oxidase assembly protein subunit 15
MNISEWNEAFEKYKQFDQYKLVNTSMTLSDFKWIFFWEWFHRLWARLIGFAAVIPLLYFMYKKIVVREDIIKIIIAIVLGAVAGTVGWIMVKSGLKENTVLVNPVNLMSHILVATLIVMYVFRTALEYLYPKEKTGYDASTRKYFTFLILLVVIQIGIGALVAGSKAALVCTTFPLMNGHYYPQEIDFSIADNYAFSAKLLFQFIHRNIAYFIFFYVVVVFFKTRNTAARIHFHRARWFLLTMVLIQLTLGILTLIYSKGEIPVTLGVLHQLGAFLLLIFAIEGHYFIKYRAIDKSSLR